MTEVALGENLKIEVPVRRVIKDKNGYAIWEFKNVKANLWICVSRYYAHSTSAFAVLGKMYQRDMLNAVPEKYRVGGITPAPTIEEGWSGNHKIETTRYENGEKIEE